MYIYNIFISILLLKIAYLDYKEHLIADKDIFIGLIATIIYRYYTSSLLDSFQGCMYNTLVIFVFYLAVKSYYKAEKFGAGDVTINILLGAILGFQDTIFLQIFAHLFMFIFILGCLILKTKKLNDRIPLAPFYVLTTLIIIWRNI